jgi:preprotein translocase subunit SecA
MSMASDDDDMPIEARLLDRAIEGAQSRVEGYNFDIRKHTVEFDDVMNRQRQIIYADRRAILEGQDMHERVLELIGEEVAALIDEHLPPEDEEQEFWDMEALVRAINSMLALQESAEDTSEQIKGVSLAELEGKSRDELEGYLLDLIESAYEEREAAIGSEQMRYVERRMMLGAIDRQWVDYLTAMDELRQSINLQAYAQRDPLVEFKRKSFDMFDELKGNITHDIVYQIIPASFRYEEYLQRIRAEQEQRLAAAQRAGADEEQGRRTRTVRKTVEMPGRNDPCPCGSGKKFKQCHLGREEEIIPILPTGGAAPRLAEQLATGQPAATDSRQAAAKLAAEVQQATAEQPQVEAEPSGGQVRRGRAAPPAKSGTPRGSGSKKKKKEKASAGRGK